MAIRGVLRVGEVAIRVLDLETAAIHYGRHIGLTEVLQEPGRRYFKAWDEHDHHSLVLREADRAGLDYFAFKVFDDATLTSLEQRIRDYGIPVERIPAGTYPRSGRRLQFQLPGGHVMQLYADKDRIGNTLPTRNPGVLPDDGVIRGMGPTRLDHVLLAGPNVSDTTRFFMDVLDFDLGEELLDNDSGMQLGTFLCCSNKPHDIAFVMNPEPGRFHHVSFFLDSVQDVYHAGDIMGKHNISVEVGPTRHGITRGATIYFYDPSGNRNEVFSGGYIHYPDRPHLTWDTTQLGHAAFAIDNTPRQSFFEVVT
ncbi:MAG: catechol 2,3-dioxygenase [Gammaproteobacteria bacterium]